MDNNAWFSSNFQAAAGAPNPPLNPNTNGEGGSNDFTDERNLGPSRVRAWACPFFKRNRHQHRDCRDKRFRHIADLRTHLQRCHSERPIHCPTCKRVFQGSNKRRKRDEHIREQACPPNYQTILIWITDQLADRLRARGMSAFGDTPEERRWYSIWEELFGPNTPYPDSCYHLFSATAELVNDAAETFTAQGGALDRLVAQVQQEMYAMYGPQFQALSVSHRILGIMAHRAVSEFADYLARNEGTIGMRPD
ncbi:hypothetical protein QBC43DRAFT_304631 [Cladorrhinum sp. PSN259]|nr:hypothetical protein QBC43DRAFT_304631 [Cladorrhinum sp. PSN259]